MKSATAPAPPYRIVVAEMSDEYGPRARADRPNVVIRTPIQDPAVWFEHFRTTAAGEHAIRLREDLAASFSGGSRQDVSRQVKKLRRKLKRRGFAVNGDHRVWRVYVGALRSEPGQQVVYVGQSSHEPAIRWAQHLSGAKNRRGPVYSRVVHRSGTHLMPALFDHLPPCYLQEDAQALETKVAAELTSIGYLVRGGH